jgi:hypothetical protein
MYCVSSNTEHSSSPWSGVVVPVVVDVVVGVVDSSLAAMTATLVMAPPESVATTPVLVMAAATSASFVDASQQLSSLYALAMSVVPKHSVVTLVIWSRRITPVAAIVAAISSFVRSVSMSVCGHALLNSTRTCCSCASLRLTRQTAVVLS